MVVTYLNVDLEDGALTRISNAKNTKHSIPCLNSNTSEAKCMRIAAALRTAADALERYIFQPTYLLENNDLCEILSDLAEEDPSREAHIRAVLQPIQPSSDSVTNRIRKCVEEIDVCIRPMVLDGKQREFRVALSEACEQVHRDWARLQKHKGRIEVSFDANSAEKWNLLTGYILKDLRKAPSSGDSSVNSNDGQTANRRSLWSVDFNQTGYVVWPTFIFEVADEQWTTPCVVLSLEQIARARDEQNSHRGKRKNSRRESTSMSSSEGAKVDGSFLSEQSPKMPNGG